MAHDGDEVSLLIERVRQGSPMARDELVGCLYERFRQRAHYKLRNERVGQSLATSDLTHEAILRLFKNDEWGKAANAHQLFRAFARSMHQVLIDRARRRKAGKRGGDARREPLDDLLDSLAEVSPHDALSLDEALRALAEEYPREADVLELRFFSGCEMSEIAAALGVSLRTIERGNQFGLAWLRDFLSKSDEA